MNDSLKPWMSVLECADYLGVNKDTVYAWIYQEKIPVHRMGRLWRFKREKLDRWIESEQPDLPHEKKPVAKKALEKTYGLQLSLDLFFEMLSQTQLCIAIAFDLKGVIQVAYSLPRGFTREDVIGKSALDFVDKKFRSAAATILKKVVQERSAETFFVKGNYSKKTYTTTCFPIFEKGEVVFVGSASMAHEKNINRLINTKSSRIGSYRLCKSSWNDRRDRSVVGYAIVKGLERRGTGEGAGHEE